MALLTPPRLLLAVLALALVAAGCGTAKNPTPDVGDITDYAALGDSFTALSGAGPFTDNACLRTETDYPALLAKDLGIKGFRNASCGGATSANLTEAQAGKGNPPQLDAVTRGTRLVTLGIGLNNYGISYNLLYLCVPVNGVRAPACDTYLAADDSAIPDVIKNMGKQVLANLKDIRKQAPKARVVLVGYPRLLPETGTCPDQLPLPDLALDRIRRSLELTNETLAGVAKKARVDYVDMYDASTGHDVCSDDPWVNGQANLPGKALAFHPYDAYHQAVADKIAALLRKG